MRMRPSRRLADRLAAQELGHDRMIVGQPLEPTTAQEIGPTVPYVGECQPIFPKQQRDEGRPHTRELCLGLRRMEDLPVRTGHRIPQPLGQGHRSALERFGRPSRCFYRELARHMPGLVSSHPVGDEKEAQTRHDGVAILVGLTAHADVSLGGGAQPHSYLPDLDANEAPGVRYRSGTGIA